MDLNEAKGFIRRRKKIAPKIGGRRVIRPTIQEDDKVLKVLKRHKDDSEFKSAMKTGLASMSLLGDKDEE
jgi:hypothetical protein